MKPPILFLFVIVIVSITGCNSLPLESKGTPTGTHEPEVLHASLYGFMWKQYDIVKPKGTEGFYRININNNYLFSLATVFSLGLYAPVEIEWWEQAKRPQAYTGEKW